jgi:tetratricopeptide (TPR) repeat protein
MENVLTRQRPGICVGWLDRRVWVVLGTGFLLAVGCSQSTSSTDADPDRNAYFQKARKFSEMRDYQNAAVFYRKALEANPNLANAHFELGLLYDDKLGDPIAAIYHYRSFLELEPNSDKRQLVEDFMQRSKLSFAAKLPHAPVSDSSDLAQLQSENAALLQENAALKARVAELERPAQSPPPAPASDAGPASQKAKTHVVQKGDTLQALALRYYGSRSAWEKIYQANQTTLPGKDQLRIGQELVIP